MKLALRTHWPLLAGLAVPLLFVLFIFASIALPRLFSQPKYDLLYRIDGDAMSRTVAYDYTVVNQRLTKTVNKQRLYSTSTTFYYYDQSTQQSRSISFEEAAKLWLNAHYRSPDGYEIATDTDGFVLRGHGTVQIIHRQLPVTPRFVGWVLP